VGRTGVRPLRETTIFRFTGITAKRRIIVNILPYLIAEVGCNHMGSMETAHEFIKTAAIFCKVDAVKFQKRCNKELLTPKQYNAPHPNPYNSYGNTYGEHREFLEFTADQHAQLKSWCEELGLTYSTSVWDLTSAKEIATLNPKFIKIPSACNNHYDMLRWLCENYSGEIHISLGMTSQNEEKALIDFFVEQGRNKDLVIYACTSGYPVAVEDVCLLEITRLINNYGNKVKQIGFSGHHNGIAVDIAAYTLGATVFERHFTLDRTWKGTDHAASLEPDGMRRLKRDLMNTQKALQHKHIEILPVEQVQRDKLKYRERESV
jgi:N-acetylneuraminate synthase